MTLAPTAPRRTLGRRAAMAAVAYAFTITMLGATLPTPLYPLMRARYGFSEFVVTIIFVAYICGVLVALVGAGSLSDRIGRRGTLLPGLAFAAISTVVFLLSSSLAALLAGRVLSGLSAGLFAGAATAAILDLADPEHKAMATLVATAANMGGLSLGSLVCGALTHVGSHPLRLPFIVHLVLLVPAFIGLWAMPETVARRNADAPRVRLRPGVPPEVRSRFALIGIAIIPGFAVTGVFGAVAPAFLGETLGHHDPALAGVAAFLVFGASLMGQVLSSRFTIQRAFVGGVIAVLAGLGFVVAALLAELLALLFLGGILCGVGLGLSLRAGLTALSEAAPPLRRGETASSFFVVAYLGTATPVLLTGFLAVEIDLRSGGLIVIGVLAAIALGSLTFLRRGAVGRPATIPAG